jgi:hypothetical protein
MKREAVFQRADLLPVLPRVIQDLLASFHDDNLPIDALVSRIASDQGLSAKLLRVANSAYFEVPFTVATVAGAVSMLGFVNVRALVISQGLLACFKDAPGLDHDRPLGEGAVRDTIDQATRMNQGGGGRQSCRQGPCGQQQDRADHLIATSSTSNTSVAPPGITPPAPRAP